MCLAPDRVRHDHVKQQVFAIGQNFICGKIKYGTQHHIHQQHVNNEARRQFAVAHGVYDTRHVRSQAYNNVSDEHYFLGHTRSFAQQQAHVDSALIIDEDNVNLHPPRHGNAVHVNATTALNLQRQINCISAVFERFECFCL